MTHDHQFHARFSIADREIGPGCPALFIAEAGVAHFGDMALARDLVDLAAEAGADVFKTQFFDVEELFADRAGDWRDRLRPRNLTLDQAHELKRRCDDKGLLFMSTAHDESRLPWLEALDAPAVKIGSGERGNLRFLRRLASLGRPMILSTGMYAEEHVREAVAACAEGGCERLALLHCVTSYPTPPEEVNLAAMDALCAMFGGPVGYSDHTIDDRAVLAAVARGAQVIEKHITILRDVPNAQDWKVSAGPEDLKPLIDDIRRVETMIGVAKKSPTISEQAASWALKSLVAARDLAQGSVLADADLAAKRPGDGIAPSRIGEVLGRRLRRPLRRDEAIALEDVE